MRIFKKKKIIRMFVILQTVFQLGYFLNNYKYKFYDSKYHRILIKFIKCIVSIQVIGHTKYWIKKRVSMVNR